MFFSIVIPSYNREKKVLHAIESILKQSFNDYEIIVVDDGSTDDTEAQIKGLHQENIRYFKTENCGVAHARNFGILKASGEYVGFLDSDDLMETEHLKTAFDFIHLKNRPKIIHLNFLWGNENRLHTEKNKLPKKLPNDIFNGCSLHVNCIFIQNSIVKQHLFNESRELMFAEDWDFFIKLAVRFPIELLDKTSVYLIDHEDRNMRNFNETTWVNKRDALILSLKSDPVISENYSSAINRVSSHMNSLIALNLALKKERKKCLHYWRLSLKQDFNELFTQRSLAVIKHLLIA